MMRSTSRRTGIQLGLVVGALLLATAGGVLLFRRQQGVADRPTYETAPVTQGPLAVQVIASGTLSPRVTVQVGSQVSGRIKELFADFNSEVTRNKVIARIDPTLFESGVARSQADVIAARAAVKRAEAQLAEVVRRDGRTQELAGKQLVAQAEADATQAERQGAEAQVAVARASLDQALAALQQARTNLEYTTIISPIDGIVISRNVDVGQTVAASLQAPTLFTIAENLRKMELHTSVAESDIGRIRDRLPVQFTVDAFPGERFAGTVKQVRYAPQTLQNVVTYDAVVEVDNDELKLRPGMTADVRFLVEQREDALLVPNLALRFRPPGAPRPGARPARGDPAHPGPGQPGPHAGRGIPGGPGAGGPGGPGRPDGHPGEGAGRRMVYRLGPEGRLDALPVRIGISDGLRTEILEGLTMGEQVVTGIAGQPAATKRTDGPRPGGFGRFP